MFPAEYKSYFKNTEVFKVNNSLLQANGSEEKVYKV